MVGMTCNFILMAILKIFAPLKLYDGLPFLFALGPLLNSDLDPRGPEVGGYGSYSSR